MTTYTVHALTRYGFQIQNYVEADSAEEAGNLIRSEFDSEVVSVSVRKALYKEWIRELTVSGEPA